MKNTLRPEFLQNLISSVIFLVGWILIKFLIYKSISKLKFNESEERRRWMVHIRNIWFIILITGFMLIWASAVKAFALSVAVIASAIAIGCKEYIMCLLGGFLKASNNQFTIGDRIAIGTMRGDVTNHTLLTTTLLEVGPGERFHQYTGKKIIVPNSIFLLTPIVNETHGSKYTLHTFKVSIPRDQDWHAMKQKLEAAAVSSCHTFMHDAQNYFEILARKRDIDPPKATPKVIVDFSDYNCVCFVIRVPSKAKEKGKLEQVILQKCFEEAI